MATSSSEPRTFVATVNEEGRSNVLRAKVPSGLIKALGGAKGDALQFEVTGKYLTGGRILRGKDADRARQGVYTQSRDANTSKKPKTSGNGSALKKPSLKKLAQPKKPVLRKIAKLAPSKVPLKTAKPSIRKTKVEYKPQSKIPRLGKSGKIPRR